MTAIWIILGVFTLIILYIILIYNRLVKMRYRFKNAFAQIDVQLRRRYDLIPNLVEAAKAYLSHEKETLSRVIEARNQAAAAAKRVSENPGDAGAMKALASAEGLLGGAMLNFNALQEAYPDLKANTTIAQLSEELASTENRVGFARQAYNDEVMIYNTQRETFPDVLFIGMMGFKPAELFEVENPEVRERIEVKF